MSMKKRFLALLMAGAMAVGMTACSTGGDSSTAESGTTEDGGSEGGAYKIALIAQHQTNAFQIAIAEAAEAKAEEMGIDLTILSADQDAATQISQIEQCVSEGFDAILFEPVDPDGLVDRCQERS